MSTTATVQGKLAEEAELLNTPHQKGLVGRRVLGTPAAGVRTVRGRGATTRTRPTTPRRRSAPASTQSGFRSNTAPAQPERLPAQIAATGAAG